MNQETFQKVRSVLANPDLKELCKYHNPSYFFHMRIGENSDIDIFYYQPHILERMLLIFLQCRFYISQEVEFLGLLKLFFDGRLSFERLQSLFNEMHPKEQYFTTIALLRLLNEHPDVYNNSDKVNVIRTLITQQPELGTLIRIIEESEQYRVQLDEYDTDWDPREIWDETVPKRTTGGERSRRRI